ncbi:MAG: hypothetical protein WBA48_04630 [Xanthobacteraceae bacterium]
MRREIAEVPLRGLDFSNWQSLFVTLIGLALFMLISIGIRLLIMFTVQQRRERMNRQINERLRTLIAAYKTLGGSFTGNLAVDPTHLGELRKRGASVGSEATETGDGAGDGEAGSDRKRRIRDAVEAALSDIILLGTEEHVRLAERAVRELIAGRPVHTGELVVSLRSFIREALDLGPIPSDLAIPMQGPARPSNGGGRGKGEGGRQGSGRGGGGGGMGMGGGGGGLGMGGGLGGTDRSPSSDHHP